MLIGKRLLQLFLLIVLSVWAVHAGTVFAADFRTGDTVHLSKGTVVDQNLFAAGSSVTIDSDVNGDLMCAGQNIIITGNVSGDILCAGQTITITGDVSGSIRAVAQHLTIESTVNRNITAAGQTVTLTNAAVAGEVYAASANSSVSGSIGRGLYLATDNAVLDATIQGNVQAVANRLTIGSRTGITGNLVYESDNNAVIDRDASISGSITRKTPVTHKGVNENKTPISSYSRDIWSVRRLFLILTWLGIGLLLVIIFPKGITSVITNLEQSASRSFTVGMLITVIMPFVLIILVFTLIGIPLAVLAGILWVFCLTFSRLFVAILVGQKILESFMHNRKDSLLLSAFIGIPLSWFAFYLPYIGWIISFFAMILGLGAVVHTIRSRPASVQGKLKKLK
jgi:hypothetical protein